MSSLSLKPTIIIAAYNEAHVISNTLTQLYTEDGLKHYQILVVCNGCSDNTEAIVLKMFPKIHCYSLEHASKALAIRYAETLAPGFPRIYLDADVSLAASGAIKLIKRADQSQSPQLVIPKSTINLEQSSPLVKRFYHAWYNTNHVQNEGYGAGTYVLNASGRARFNVWPNLTADDAFIRSQFHQHETFIETSVNVAVRAPKTAYWLIQVKTRSKYGNMELKSYIPKHGLQHRQRTSPLSQKARKPHLGKIKNSFNLLVYLTINCIALCLAKSQFITGKKKWHRDLSNRSKSSY